MLGTIILPFRNLIPLSIALAAVQTRILPYPTAARPDARLGRGEAQKLLLRTQTRALADQGRQFQVDERLGLHLVQGAAQAKGGVDPMLGGDKGDALGSGGRDGLLAEGATGGFGEGKGNGYSWTVHQNLEFW